MCQLQLLVVSLVGHLGFGDLVLRGLVAWALPGVICFSGWHALHIMADLGWLFSARSLLVPMTAAVGTSGG